MKKKKKKEEKQLIVIAFQNFEKKTKTPTVLHVRFH